MRYFYKSVCFMDREFETVVKMGDRYLVPCTIAAAEDRKDFLRNNMFRNTVKHIRWKSCHYSSLYRLVIAARYEGEAIGI